MHRRPFDFWNLSLFIRAVNIDYLTTFPFILSFSSKNHEKKKKKKKKPVSGKTRNFNTENEKSGRLAFLSQEKKK